MFTSVSVEIRILYSVDIMTMRFFAVHTLTLVLTFPPLFPDLDTPSLLLVLTRYGWTISIINPVVARTCNIYSWYQQAVESLSTATVIRCMFLLPSCADLSTIWYGSN